MKLDTVIQGKALGLLQAMADNSIDCCVTSPPYWGLRDYGIEGQYGLEKTPQEYVENMAVLFREVRRVLKPEGTLWLNLGDSYAGSWGAQSRPNGSDIGSTLQGGSTLSARQIKEHPKRTNTGSLKNTPSYKPKDLIGIPWMVSEALRVDGWWRRDAIIWAKPNGMPGSQQDRPTSSYEFVFLMSKSARYWSDFDAIKTPPRESSLIRAAQEVQMQAGSHRANGGAKTNGAMKGVGVYKDLPEGQSNIRKARDAQRGRVDKQRGHSRRHAGFNDRWDAMSREEQMSVPAMIRNVWFIPPAQSKDAHFAVMPEEIARRCILAGCPEGGVVLDPFFGSGTTGVVARKLGRKFIGIELNPAYVAIAERRLAGVPGSLFATGT